MVLDVGKVGRMKEGTKNVLQMKVKEEPCLHCKGEELRIHAIPLRKADPVAPSLGKREVVHSLRNLKTAASHPCQIGLYNSAVHVLASKLRYLTQIR